MPVRNIYSIKQGTNLQLDPAALAAGGPRLQVEISIHPALETILQTSKQTIPAPIIGTALVDTGASVTSVDATILTSLGIPPIGTTQVFTPSGNATQQMHPCKISFPGSALSPITFNFVCGASLKPQGIDVLLGRDVLMWYVLVYNGPGGHFSLSG